MSKQRYLAELQRLLVFMTEEDREQAIRHFGDIFDAVGEEGEASLLETLGSPTKSAISLSRGYEPGSVKNLPDLSLFTKKTKAALTDTDGDPWGDLPTFDSPPAETDETPAEPEEAVSHEDVVPAPEEELPLPAEPEKKERSVDRPMPLGVGIPLLALILIAIGIPVAGLFLGLMVVCVAPGSAVIFGAYLAAVGGLWCLSYLADALLMFGLAFLILSVGLLVLWGGIWLCSRLVLGYVLAVRWLSGVLLGKKVSDYE